MTSVSTPATWLAGYIPDIPTPFDEHGAVDLAAFAMLCERQIDAGVTAILVSETGGEASTLTPAEQEDIIRAAVDVARGRVRVIAGAGSNSTSQAIELTQRAEAAGADAVLSVVPYYNKPMQAGIQAHFRAIAISTALPIILHDIPSRTMRELSDDTLLRLASSRRFIGLKDGNRRHHAAVALAAAAAGRVSTIVRRRRNGAGLRRQWRRRLHFHRLERRAGVVPGRFFRIAGWRGRRPRDTCLNRLVPLTAALTKESPAALKYALCLLGFMSPATRLPIVELTEDAKAEVASAIAEIGDEDIACPVESWHGPRLHEDSVAQS